MNEDDPRVLLVRRCIHLVITLKLPGCGAGWSVGSPAEMDLVPAAAAFSMYVGMQVARARAHYLYVSTYIAGRNTLGRKQASNKRAKLDL